jgi:phosphatidate cytidylyltransferase
MESLLLCPPWPAASPAALSLWWSVWPRLVAVFAVLLAILYVAPRLRPFDPILVRGLRVKLAIFAAVVHVLLALFLCGGLWLHAGLAVLAVLAARELCDALLPPDAPMAYRRVAVLGALVVAASASPVGREHTALVLAALLAAATPVLLGQPRDCHRHVAATALILILAGLLPASLWRLHADHGAAAAFVLLIITLNDGFAEAAGRLLGRRRFFAAISPGKTLAGAGGGRAMAAGGSVLFAPLLPLSWPLRLGVAVAVAVAGNAGDLMFSALKRGVGQKDFAATLPAHGGVLDRFDSLFFAAPLFYYYLLLFGR